MNDNEIEALYMTRDEVAFYLDVNIRRNRWRVIVKCGINPDTGRTRYQDKIVRGTKDDARALEVRLAGGRITPQAASRRHRRLVEAAGLRYNSSPSPSSWLSARIQSSVPHLDSGTSPE
jgi:hypothetical protein